MFSSQFLTQPSLFAEIAQRQAGHVIGQLLRPSKGLTSLITFSISSPRGPVAWACKASRVRLSPNIASCVVIADDDANTRFVDEKKIIEIAADLPRRDHPGVKAELLAVQKGREGLGQNRDLLAKMLPKQRLGMLFIATTITFMHVRSLSLTWASIIRV